MSEKTRGQQIINEWRRDIADNYHIDNVLDHDLASRIDAELANIADVADVAKYLNSLDRPKRVLDLSEVFFWDADGPRAVYLEDVKAAIRTQLPDVEVRT